MFDFVNSKKLKELWGESWCRSCAECKVGGEL